MSIYRIEGSMRTADDQSIAITVQLREAPGKDDVQAVKAGMADYLARVSGKSVVENNVCLSRCSEYDWWIDGGVTHSDRSIP